MTFTTITNAKEFFDKLLCPTEQMLVMKCQKPVYMLCTNHASYEDKDWYDVIHFPSVRNSSFVCTPSTVMISIVTRDSIINKIYSVFNSFNIKSDDSDILDDTNRKCGAISEVPFCGINLTTIFIQSRSENMYDTIDKILTIENDPKWNASFAKNAGIGYVDFNIDDLCTSIYKELKRDDKTFLVAWKGPANFEVFKSKLSELLVLNNHLLSRFSKCIYEDIVKQWSKDNILTTVDDIKRVYNRPLTQIELDELEYLLKNGYTFLYEPLRNALELGFLLLEHPPVKNENKT
jgi:hypothetical protein